MPPRQIGDLGGRLEMDLSALLAGPAMQESPEIIVSSEDEAPREDVADEPMPAVAPGGPHEVAEGGALVVADAQPAQQQPARLPPRSQATARNARLHRAARMAMAKAKAAEEKAGNMAKVLGGVASLLPGVAKIVGPGAKATTVGRLSAQSLKPTHFLVLCRAAFLPAKSNVQVGMKFKRLLASATKAILHRQEVGLERLLQGSHAALATSPEGEGRTIHLAYSHLWDEVNAKFVYNPSSSFRSGRAGVHVQTIVQRGAVSCTLISERHNAARCYQENWFVQPKKVEGTSAAALWPAVRGAFPKALDLLDPDRMAEVCDKVSSCTVQFVCDKASGNLLLLKEFAAFYEKRLAPTTNARLLLWPETCTVHLHHRCKLQARALRPHTMRHFSLANLARLSGVRSHIVSWLETHVPNLVVRRVTQPRPDTLPGNLATVIEVLYKLSHDHHDRKRGRKSMRHDDLSFLGTMVNGNVLGEWEHFCFDNETGRPCCENLGERREKTTRAIINFFQGEAEPIPAESRWTHTLTNFKKTLLRKAIYGVGVRSFPGSREVAEPEQASAGDIDAEAVAEHKAELNKTRLSRTSAYLNNPATWTELAALTLVLDVVDTHLLYPLLGDPILADNDRASKVDKLLDPEDSLLGKCSEGLLNLLDSWAAVGDARMPWCVFDAVGGDLRDQQCMRFSRSQILRMHSAFARRYLTRYGTWPYSLYALCSDKFDQATKAHTAESLLRAPEVELDIYSLGIRRLFNTVDKLLSLPCKATLAADFRSQALSTDVIERLNAEITATTPRRAPARSFANASRECFLRQVVVAHKAKGGLDPLGGAALVATNKAETVVVCPLLDTKDAPPQHAGQGGGGGPRSAAVGPAAPAPEGTLVEAPRRGDNQHDEEIVPQGGFFGEPRLVSREVSSCLPFAGASKGVKRRRGAGLSPYMLELNKTMKAARRQKKKPLSKTEMRQIRAEFRAQWLAMGDHAVFREAFDNFRSTPKKAKRSSEEPKPYKLMWDGGCPNTPLTADEFWAWQQQFGWPSDAEVFDEESPAVLVRPDTDCSFDSKVRLWGIGRSAHNIDRARVPSERQFNMVETGLLNFIDSLTKPVADAGDVMIVVQGRPRGDHVEGTVKCAAILTGTSYSPKIFDVTPCEPEQGQRFFATGLDQPFLVKIASGACRAAQRFNGIGFETSDEFILGLVENLADMSLYKAAYEVVETGDGTLRWSRVRATERIGVLWEPGLTRPLLAPHARLRGPANPDAVLKRLRTGNPLEPSSRPVGKSVGRQQGGRGRATSKPSALARREHALPLPALADADRDAQTEPSRGNDGAARDSSGLEEALAAIMDEEMDLADGEDGASGESELEELAATYGVAAADDGTCMGRTGDIGDDLEGGIPEVQEDPEVAGLVAACLSGAAAAANLEQTRQGDGAGSSSDPPAASAAEPEASPPPPKPMWQELSDPSGVSGYMYCQGRSIARVQYGKPKNSVTITCYRHTSCNLLVAESRCPDIQVIKQWVFEVEPNPAGATSEEKKALAKRHMGLGRARWFKGRQS